MVTGPKPRDVTERFWGKVAKGGPDECWILQGSLNTHGYGLLNTGSRTDKSRKREFAHRLSYRFHFGNFENELFVCHRCDVPPYVNPNHLFLGDQKANMSDAKAKGHVRKATATHCIHGHAFDEANTYWHKGKRQCRKCVRAGQIKHFNNNRERERARSLAYYHSHKILKSKESQT
jgi:hypothetical protein